MLGGIALQLCKLPNHPLRCCHILTNHLVAIIIYTFIASEFLWRYKNDSPCRKDESPRGNMDKGIRRMIVGLRISTVLLAIRYDNPIRSFIDIN